MSAALKLVLAKWIEQVAVDPSTSLYDFRLANRLCSKVRGESLNISFRKLHSNADTAALDLLLECGHLLKLDDAPAARRCVDFRLVIKGGAL